jgi:hypothetical protein
MNLKNHHNTAYFIIIISLLVQLSSACKKENDIPVHETGTVTDIDGNLYQTVKIGNQ